MEVTVNRYEVIEALKYANKHVSNRGALPILAHVQLRAENGIMTVRRTDLTVDIEQRIDLEDQPDVTLDRCVHAQTLLRVLDAMTGVDCTIDETDTHVIIIGDNSKHMIASLLGEEFPVSTPVEGDNTTIAVSKTRFADAMIDTSHAVSRDATRVALNGIYLDGGHAVAIDGRRLARSIWIEGNHDADVIIPLQAAIAIASIPSDDNCITVRLSANSIQAVTGSCVLRAQLVQGEYPSYRQVIPEAEHSAEFKVEDCIAAVKQCYAVNVKTDIVQGVKLKAQKGRKKVDVSFISNGNAAESSFDLTEAAPAQLVFCVNPDYLLDALKTVRADHVTLGWTDDLIPISLTCDRPGFLQIIMPISIT